MIYVLQLYISYLSCRKHTDMTISAFSHYRACLSLDSVYLNLAFPSLNCLRIVIWWVSISRRWTDSCLKILRIREIARLSTRAHHREDSSPRWADLSWYYSQDLTTGIQRARKVWGSDSSVAEDSASSEIWYCFIGQVVPLHFEGSYWP